MRQGAKRLLNPVQWLASLLTLGGLAWAGHSLATLFWVVTPLPDASAFDTAPQALLQSQQPLRTVDFALLEQAFRLSGAAPVSMTESNSAADTRLQLTLQGTIASSDPVRASAIIASGSAQHIYRPGDSIAGTIDGVRLQSVHTGYVLLSNNGREERLPMDDSSAATTAGGSAVSAMSVNTTMTERAPAVLSPDSAALASILRVQFAELEGRGSGLQIRHGSRADLLSAVGLRMGDLVTAINGEAITNASHLARLYQGLAQAGTVSLTVSRDDGEHQIVVDAARLGLR